MADMENAETVVIPVKLGLTGLDVRLCRVPGPDLGWSEAEWSPVGGDGSDGFSIPGLEASLIH
ncbi:MAG: hypothetical protein ACLQU5_36655 [Isosphaeraceae bacterium]